MVAAQLITSPLHPQRVRQFIQGSHPDSPSLLALILSSIHTALEEVGWFPFSAVLRPNKLELAAAA